MPCPPSWEELEIMRFDYAFNEVTPKFTKYSIEIVATSAFILQWNVAQGNTVLSSDIEKEMGIAAQYSSSTPPAWTEKPIPHDGYPGDPQFQQMARQLQWYQDQVSALELALCILRTWIMNNCESNLSHTPELSSAFEAEKELHLKHRKEDRDAYIKKQDGLIGAFMHQLRSLTEESYIRPLEKEIETIKKKQAVVIALSDEELLKNRMLF